jgi:septum formation protein
MSGLWRGTAPIVLASQSPARQELLAAAGIPFEVFVAAIDEREIEAALVAAGAGAGDVARHLSRAKTLKVSGAMPDRLIIGADQVLCLEGCLFGKPADRAAAIGQLQAMSGRTHELYSGCCAARENRTLFETVCVARLRCRQLSAVFIETYMAQAGGGNGAGTYRIEGLGIHLFDAIEGDHTTILGLPLLPLLKFLRDEGSLLS